MTYIIIVLIVVVIFQFVKNPKIFNLKNSPPDSGGFSNENAVTNSTKNNYDNAYKRKWMFSNNEKYAYYKLKEITDEKGYFLFAKVRLFDLIEPKQNTKNNKGAMWKIQAKHVDFVICDKNLVAKTIIELDDSSHNSSGRRDRDLFVDTVLKNSGYNILHMGTIDAKLLANI